MKEVVAPHFHQSTRATTAGDSPEDSDRAKGGEDGDKAKGGEDSDRAKGGHLTCPHRYQNDNNSQ